jgi:hypothetical protein
VTMPAMYVTARILHFGHHAHHARVADSGEAGLQSRHRNASPCSRETREKCAEDGEETVQPFRSWYGAYPS